MEANRAQKFSDRERARLALNGTIRLVVPASGVRSIHQASPNPSFPSRPLVRHYAYQCRENLVEYRTPRRHVRPDRSNVKYKATTSTQPTCSEARRNEPYCIHCSLPYVRATLPQWLRAVAPRHNKMTKTAQFYSPKMSGRREAAPGNGERNASQAKTSEEPPRRLSYVQAP